MRTNTSATQWSVAAVRLRALAWYETRELGTDRFARASQHDAGSERLVHTAQQQLVGQGDQVAREHQGGEHEPSGPSGPSADTPMAEREAQKSGVTFSDCGFTFLELLYVQRNARG